MAKRRNVAEKFNIDECEVITLSGYIRSVYDDNFHLIHLRQNDGLLVNLHARLKELEVSFGDRLGFTYYVADTEKTEEQMIQGLLHSYYGNVTNENNIHYGCETCGPSYDSTLEIGGHDLYNELMTHCNGMWNSKDGKYILLKIYYPTKKK